MMMDTDFPAITPGKQFLLDFLPQVPVTEKPKGYFRENLEGSRSAFMTGTGMEPVGAAQQYQQREGGPIFGETIIAGNPSFDIEKPGYGPAVSPQMFRSEMERLYPGHNERRQNAVPNLIKKFGGYSALEAANQGPSTPVRYDESMGGFVPNQGAGRPANVRYKGVPIGA